jgi:orotate phosphoribosyltransferase-like protein
MIDYELFSKIKHLNQNDGLTAQQIARELVLDVRTVEKWLNETQYRPRRSVQREPASSIPSKTILSACLERHAYTANADFSTDP